MSHHAPLSAYVSYEIPCCCHTLSTILSFLCVIFLLAEIKEVHLEYGYMWIYSEDDVLISDAMCHFAGVLSRLLTELHCTCACM